ncbi:hypothetical protein LOTGIDRAFT_169806 [Lottia gigantea]|uniref:Uncharacterized protein n=1 Tax=Lottia gigantea TaxID=225164 RepID=V3ZQ31_LOTGI|nr:hypothetical protein LOTGIDRAFT_169806 [Lottia gigantea]ESO82981.1 hypothetical protein LOTGIDRAFT_169806 [Lottia gigantea]
MSVSTDSTTGSSTESKQPRQEEVTTSTPLVITETSTEYISTTTEKSYASEEAFLTDDMINGLASGFGFFFGTIILIVLLWCLCCTNNCMKKDEPQKLMRPRVGPSPPPKADSRNRSR